MPTPTLSTLPTELRHEILRWVLITPLPPPSAPDEVPDAKWLHLGMNIKYKQPRPQDSDDEGEMFCCPPPCTWINSSQPWDCPHLSLLLVDKAFKADTEVVLSRFGAKVTPMLDIAMDDDLFGTWLLLPPLATASISTLEINIRIVRSTKVTCHQTDSTGPGPSMLSIVNFPARPTALGAAGDFWDSSIYPPGQLQTYLLRILNARRNRYRSIGLGKGSTHIKTIRINYTMPSGVQEPMHWTGDSMEALAHPHPYNIAKEFAERWERKCRHFSVRRCYDVIEVCVGDVWAFRLDSRCREYRLLGEPVMETNENHLVPSDGVLFRPIEEVART